MAPLHVTWGSAAELAREAADAQFAAGLSEGERERLAAIRSPARREQFLAARWLARKLLSQVHGSEPLDWPLGAGRDGPPPVLRDTAGPVHLALTHSNGFAACALSQVAIGLDLEAPSRRRDVVALAQIACDEVEQALLRAQPLQLQQGFFHELWTAKEAWIKRLAQPMAPRRMARIHLRPAPAFDSAPVRVWSTAPWTLALAAPAGLEPQWHAPAPAARSAWAVHDEGEA